MEPDMKRKGNIFKDITELSNIEAAIYKASVNKTKRKSVQKILDSPSYYALQIQKMLIEKTYVPGPYIETKIYDRATQKERVIYKSHFYPDQIIYWAIMNKI